MVLNAFKKELGYDVGKNPKNFFFDDFDEDGVFVGRIDLILHVFLDIQRQNPNISLESIGYISGLTARIYRTETIQNAKRDFNALKKAWSNYFPDEILSQPNINVQSPTFFSQSTDLNGLDFWDNGLAQG